jgi:hypothetical protein
MGSSEYAWTQNSLKSFNQAFPVGCDALSRGVLLGWVHGRIRKYILPRLSRFSCYQPLGTYGRVD